MSSHSALCLPVRRLDIIQISHSATSPKYLYDTEDALRPPRMQMHIPLQSFSPFFQCHMQNRPAAADAGLSAGVINTNTRATKYRPHSLAYKTSACNAKICGEKFTALFQIHTHTEIWAPIRADVQRRVHLWFILHQAVTPQVCLCLHACHCAAYMYARVTLCTQVQTSVSGVDICMESLMHSRCGSHFLYTMPLGIVQTSTGATRGAFRRSSHPSEPH